MGGVSVVLLIILIIAIATVVHCRRSKEKQEAHFGYSIFVNSEESIPEPVMVTSNQAYGVITAEEIEEEQEYDYAVVQH